jgi:hypothetical protein
MGGAGMQKLVLGCPALGARDEFRAVMNLQAIDCIATRLWFDRRVRTRFPANVLSGFEPFNTGATFFDLNTLQVRLIPGARVQIPKRSIVLPCSPTQPFYCTVVSIGSFALLFYFLSQYNVAGLPKDVDVVGNSGCWPIQGVCFDLFRAVNVSSSCMTTVFGLQ